VPQMCPGLWVAMGHHEQDGPANSIAVMPVVPVATYGLTREADSKSTGGNPVRVRISPRALSG
jgi:hypothetical protein